MDELRRLLIAGEAEAAVKWLGDLLRREPARAGELARAATQTLLEIHQALRSGPALAFAELMPRRLPEPVARAMASVLEGPFGRTRHWIGELESIRRERLAREARAAVTVDDLKKAARRGLALIERGTSLAERTQLSRYLVEALAGLWRDRERSARVIAEVFKAGGIEKLGLDLQTAFEEAVARPANRLEESDREWTSQLGQGRALLKEYLPGPLEAGEPTEAQVGRFHGEALALLAAGAVADRPDELIDPLLVLVDYCPTDPPEFESAAKAETRAFLTIGPRAKLTAVRALARLGENAELRRRLDGLTEAEDAPDRLPMLAALMGGLRHPDFYPFLKSSIRRASTFQAKEAVVDALGRLAIPEAAALLVDELERAMKRLSERMGLERVKTVLTALGRLGRRQGLDPDFRRKLVGRVVKIVGEGETAVGVMAAERMFSVETEALDRPSRAWAVRCLMRPLFGLDTAQQLKAGSASPLGYRAPLVGSLTRLGPEMLPEMLEIAARHTAHYGGAFQAFAELVQRIGDERAVPVLDAMLRTAFLHDAEAEPAHAREVVVDAGAGGTRSLDRDEVIHGLLFALEKAGGEAGRRIALGYADQIQTGQLRAPGESSASFLVQLKRRHGTLGRREAETPEADVVDEAGFQRALALARGGLFATTRKRIEGLALLGRSRRPEVAPVILKALGEKDPLVHNAAETALSQLVAPPPSPEAFERLLQDLFAENKLLAGAGFERLVFVIQRIFPKNPPYDAVFRRQVESHFGQGERRHRLLGVLAASAEAGAGDGASPEPTTAEARVHLLQARREYLARRRAWVAAGKRGPAPEPPPGLPAE